ncbi:MAG TPA: ATP-binding cassette domain-containing protein [Verrucomicrobiota bacterium]|nr:ABC transporter ATP-binding protein [Verrucomicrobiales bacterium]HRI12390.1 ATP-binding cassette domain-containing protein [Verrucomicrobiota bacterium]
MFPPALELRSVTKTYGDFMAVDDLSLAVPTGCVFGFLGPNGAGKTTCLRMILEIIRPTSGSITVLGSPSSLAIRERIGYLPEEKGLYKKMKAWAIIAYFATLKGLSRSAAKLRAFQLLERYGLKDFAEAKTEALSKGMGQKVQVLAAIAHDPEFVILDEPFSGLDPVNQTVMEEIITDLRARGRTVIFSTHVMAHAERLCDRLSIIAKGRKLFDGTLVEAHRSLPRRVRLQTEDNVEPLRALPEVANVVNQPNGLWELELKPGADGQAVLQSCFAQQIRLRAFNFDKPTLHDVFVKLVGPDAKEAAFR